LRKKLVFGQRSVAKQLYSLDERIDKITRWSRPTMLGPARLVTAHSGDEDLIHMSGTRPISGSVDQLLKPKRFPDLLLLWIGNNNLDWVNGASPACREHPEKYLQERAKRFRVDYTRQMRRLISRAEGEDHPVAIVVLEP